MPCQLLEDTHLGARKIACQMLAEKRHGSQRDSRCGKGGATAIVDALGLHPFEEDGRAVPSLNIDKVKIAIDAEMVKVETPGGVIHGGIALVVGIKLCLVHSRAYGVDIIRLTICPHHYKIEHRDAMGDDIFNALKASPLNICEFVLRVKP